VKETINATAVGNPNPTRGVFGYRAAGTRRETVIVHRVEAGTVKTADIVRAAYPDAPQMIFKGETTFAGVAGMLINGIC